eukprot:NODE_9707_length_224_cov_2.668571_g9092_i0.p2 GENE.NODE_9707_length_224_cov_2.668571_g9092_i0~~NODE_9707_length_224_cov_2.668571_g9092_i0.p2  ORF type:complete len:54 (-),score=0.36 NODE_9707_length_224_cov_2.668571_g9092_i0:31-192(-)
MNRKLAGESRCTAGFVSLGNSGIGGITGGMNNVVGKQRARSRQQPYGQQGRRR